MNLEDLTKEQLIDLLVAQHQSNTKGQASNAQNNILMSHTHQPGQLQSVPAAPMLLTKTVINEILRPVNPANLITHRFQEERYLDPVSGGEHKIVTVVKYHDDAGLQLIPGKSRLTRCQRCGRVYDLVSKGTAPCGRCDDHVCKRCSDEIDGERVLVRQVVGDKIIESVQTRRRRVCHSCIDNNSPNILAPDAMAIFAIAAVIALIFAALGLIPGVRL